MVPSLSHSLAALGDAVWSADTLGDAPGATLASGYPALDAVLPGAGWPLDALSELLQPPGLHAEWRLLLPALVRLQQASDGALVLVGPPHVPFGPSLQAQGLAVQRLLWLQVSEPQARLWATEQALRCAGCNWPRKPTASRCLRCDRPSRRPIPRPLYCACCWRPGPLDL